jgi:hypothetical protein
METDAKDCTDPKYIAKVSELVTRYYWHSSDAR